MNYKQIESSREVRLWIGQIIVPAIIFATTTMAIPEVRQAVKLKAISIKESLQNKVKKEP